MIILLFINYDGVIFLLAVSSELKLECFAILKIDNATSVTGVC